MCVHVLQGMLSNNCVFLLKRFLAAVCLCVHDIERGKERGGEKD